MNYVGYSKEPTLTKDTEMTFKQFKTKCEQAFNENPILFIAVSAAALNGAAKLIDALAGAQSKAAYARRMNAGVN